MYTSQGFYRFIRSLCKNVSALKVLPQLHVYRGEELAGIPGYSTSGEKYMKNESVCLKFDQFNFHKNAKY